MHSAIVVVKMPARDRDGQWDKFTTELDIKVRADQGVFRLAENVWLVNFQQSPVGLAWIVGFADRLGFEYGILQLADEPRWLPDGFDPKPK